MTKEQEFEFAEQEHKAGFHNTFMEDCYECHREDRLLRSKMIVSRTLPYEKGELHNWHGDNYPLGFSPQE